MPPLELIYFEACRNRDDAFRRERFLETGKGKRFLKHRLRAYLESISWNKLERHWAHGYRVGIEPYRPGSIPISSLLLYNHRLFL